MIALYEYLGIPIIFQLYDIAKFFDKENLRDIMDILHEIGVDPKLCRTWVELNKNTNIRVKTANGFTDWRNVVELLGQGSGGGAMASAANLDRGVDDYFKGSVLFIRLRLYRSNSSHQFTEAANGFQIPRDEHRDFIQAIFQYMKCVKLFF